jgi:trehalose-6-phosphate synthase
MRSSSITSLTEHDDVALAQSTGIRMVFFLHIPFPTSQVFRELQHGEAILEGMLHADVVGFHAFDHARHFLNASKRILGLTYESLMGGLIGVRFHGKKVLVTMSNVSIETDMVDGMFRDMTFDHSFHSFIFPDPFGNTSFIDVRSLLTSLLTY